MDRFNRFVHWMVVFSVAGHMFCCVLPLVVSFLSMMVGLGMLSGVLPMMDALHHHLHGYETWMVVFSGVLLVMGWGVQWFSTRFDCHDTGCQHPPCDPKKKRNARILCVATGLFCINLIVLFLLSH